MSEKRNSVEKRISALRPEFQLVATQWLQRVRDELKLDVRITETLRSVGRQVSLQKSGASSTKFGWHQVGLALDFLIFDNKKVIHDGTDSRYAKCGAIAAELGCKYPIRLAGGKIDAGHLEYHPGMTLQQLLAAISQGIVKPWPPVEKP